jgi:hypothetical protein
VFFAARTTTGDAPIEARFEAVPLSLSDHLEDGPHILGNAAMHENETVLQTLARRCAHIRSVATTSVC